MDTLRKAIDVAKDRHVAIPRLPFAYVDDVWCLLPYPRQGLRSATTNPRDPALDFQECLNSIHPRVQFTKEEESEHSIAFLDVYVTREDDGTFSTRVYRKPSNTNVTIKPQSCQHPDTVKGIFKGELCRAYRLCSSPEKTQAEIKFIIDMFEDNGFDRKMLENIASNYKPSATPTGRNKHQNNKTKENTPDPENLFNVLPFHNDNTESEEKKPYVVMPYLPDGVFHQMKRACTKAGVQLITKPGTKLKDILCAPNRTRHDAIKKPGVYKLKCECADNSIYVGQTIRPIETRIKEHRNAAEKGKWAHSGISQHKESCKVDVNWEPEVLKSLNNKNKKKLTYDLKVREALEIKRHNCGPGKGLNEDFGAYVKTTQWNPVFHQMDKG